MAHVKETPILAPRHTFIRSYQACVPCRKRKVKCDLGDPGNPTDPPCRRCRREHKECFFQDLRTKKGGPSKPNDSSRSPKRIRSATPEESILGAVNVASTSRLDPGSDLYSSPTSGPISGSLIPSESATTDRILHKEVHNASEALNLLYEAAAETRSDNTEGTSIGNDLNLSVSNKESTNAAPWREFWCVKAGWITDMEARDYVDLFVSVAISDPNEVVSSKTYILLLQ